MGAYKTNWKLTETVMPEDFNRIEENIKENNKKHDDFKTEYDKTLKEQNKKIDSKLEKEDVLLKVPWPTDRDCNSFKTLNAFFSFDTSTGDFKNTPEGTLTKGSSKIFIVTNKGYSSERIQQEWVQIYPQNKIRKYTRNLISGEWGNWYKNYDEANKPSWNDIEAKPSTFTPAIHNHDDRYLQLNKGRVSDFNTCKDPGVYTISGSNITNAPIIDSIYGTLEVLPRGDAFLIQRITLSSGMIFTRYFDSNIWTSWVKNYNSANPPDDRYLNKRVGRVTDFNICTSPGIYIVSSGTAIPNSPISSGIYGTLLVQPRDDELSQLLVTSTGRIFTRYQGYDKTWTNWTRVYSTSDKPTWDEVINKPSTFSPSTHNHDTLYARIDRGTVTDFNQCKNIGTYNISGKDIPNAPFKGNIYGTLEVLPRGSDKVQRVITSSGASYVRFYAEGGVNTGFREWVKVYTSTNKPSWNDIEAKPSTFTPATHNHDDSYLKKSNGFVSDFNKCLTEGIYSVGSDNAIPNGPVNGGIYGVLEVFKKKNEYLQRCTNFNGQTYVRYLNYKNEWLPWNRIISNNDFITGTVDGKYYMKLPNNMLIQWGHVIVTIAEGFNNASSLVYFPVSFASDYMCTGNVAANDFGGYAEVNASVIQENPTRAFTQVFTLNGRAPGGGKKVRVNWMAIGRY
ncbi:Siphovirus protein of uncharacterised function (DUF859) [[Clostridium] sordellii]|uniref:pyocin knob domain-containing protein n=1 Tax=Paraclostridium sordellii TaxID=1505 RepID=UPI0005DB12ED|nr:pyocin knob domain-containing protein [Paeniclostridium sordellii]CEQ08658.1 Siphovirus protein of uncharacterised function (DUF859) [[Clostridium] sordellii] [Paeniclostridium sordellii]